MGYCQRFRYLGIFLVLAFGSEGCAYKQDKSDFIRAVRGAYYSLPPRCEQAMKTAGREKQTSREHGADGRNTSCSNKRAAKQEKL